jgi:hypothetical protein
MGKRGTLHSNSLVHRNLVKKHEPTITFPANRLMKQDNKYFLSKNAGKPLNITMEVLEMQFCRDIRKILIISVPKTKIKADILITGV